ncbi:MAG: M48 family metallopeptidase [Gemmatimonadaceae bacterium]
MNLFQQQEANRRRSRWLVLGFIIFFAWLGFGGDWIAYELTLPDPAAPTSDGYRHTFPWFGLALGAIAAGLAWQAWRSGADAVLWSAGALEILSPANDAQAQYVNVVEEMAIAAGVPRPRVFIVRDRDPNAFATGRSPDDGRVAVTVGLLALCTRDELQGIIGHEIAHIRNHDVRLMTLLAGLLGAVALVSDGLGRALRHDGPQTVGRAARGLGRRGKGMGPLLPIVIAVWLASWFLAPLISRLLALGVSRKREYLADAMSAQFTRNPMALASALHKIEAAADPTSSIRHGAAHLCIADPLGRRASVKEGRLADFFGTHPPMALRVARLKAMAYRAIKERSTPAPAA